MQGLFLKKQNLILKLAICIGILMNVRQQAADLSLKQTAQKTQMGRVRRVGNTECFSSFGRGIRYLIFGNCSLILRLSFALPVSFVYCLCLTLDSVRIEMAERVEKAGRIERAGTGETCHILKQVYTKNRKKYDKRASSDSSVQ